MGSGINKKQIKVVWLCHFNNEYISERLGIKLQFEFAPWISRFVDIFEKNNEVEIHIISPNPNIVKYKSFAKENIHFYFFPYLFPLIPKRLINFFHYRSNFIYINTIVKYLINKINPDIIHLFGTENAYYASSILQFKNKYPVLITIQGFANKLLSSNYRIRKRKKVEIKIIKNFKYYGIRDEEMKSFIKDINPDAHFFYHEIAPYKPKVSSKTNNIKKYDIVFFARVCKEKGIEDLIRALSIIKKKKNNISLCVIGQGSPSYYAYLKRLSHILFLEKNIIFIGELKTIEELHNFVLSSRICVLPTYADTIPGTIIESMFIGIPCISYAVGGIPSLNENEENIILVKKNDIEDLAYQIDSLLNKPDYAHSMAERAKRYVSIRWNDDIIYKSILNIYNHILIASK